MDDIENECHFVCLCTIHGVKKYISHADPGSFARGVQGFRGGPTFSRGGGSSIYQERGPTFSRWSKC